MLTSTRKKYEKLKQLITAGKNAARWFLALKEHWCELTELLLVPEFSME